jgi:hypothetical protein
MPATYYRWISGGERVSIVVPKFTDEKVSQKLAIGTLDLGPLANFIDDHSPIE